MRLVAHMSVCIAVVLPKPFPSEMSAITGLFPWMLLTIRPWNDESAPPRAIKKLYSLLGVRMENIFLKASLPPSVSERSSNDLVPLQ